MYGKVVGLGIYQSKNGNERCNVFIQEEPPKGHVGICVRQINCSKDILPDVPEKMLNQTYVIDTNSGYANKFYKMG